MGAPLPATPECPENELYTPCSSSSCFESRCGELPSEFCTKDCKMGCKCVPGFARNGTKCIPQTQCAPPVCPDNEIYTPCSSSSCFESRCGELPSEFCTKDCKMGCKCLLGFARNGTKCIPQTQCPPPVCPENEIYTPCSSSSCFESKCGVPDTSMCTKDCKAGCKCAKGFARNGTKCVPLNLCPVTNRSFIPETRGAFPSGVGAVRMQSSPERCVVSSSNSEGAVLSLHVCDKKTDLQVDTEEREFIRVATDPQLCLAANSLTLQVGDVVMLAACSASINQRFRFNDSDGSIRSLDKPLLCVDSKAALLALATCNGGRSQQFEVFNNGCSAFQTAELTDFGAADAYRGWYDTQGCGICRDYCRWVGPASGGDPAVSREEGGSHWSCALAGSVREFTLPQHFDYWNFSKCENIALPDDADAQLAGDAETVDEQVPRRVARRDSPSPAGNASASNSSGLPPSNSSGWNVTAPMGAQAAAAPLAVATKPASEGVAIPLGILGGLVALFLLTGLGVWLWRRHKRPAKEAPKSAAAPSDASAGLTQTTDPEREDSVEPGQDRVQG